MRGRRVVVSGKLGARGWLLAVDDCMFYLAVLLHSLQAGKRKINYIMIFKLLSHLFHQMSVM